MSTPSDQSSGKAGLSTLDLMNTSPGLNRVVRMMLKKNRQTRAELEAANLELPPEKQLSHEHFEKALADLEAMGWLEKVVDDGVEIYQVKIAPKSSTVQPDSSGLPPLEALVAEQGQPSRGGMSGLFKRLFGGKR